jgi:kynureninase
MNNKIVNYFIKKSGVYGHFEGELPWADCEMPLKPAMAKLVGAKSESEINILNFLTVNLHLLMITFYEPTKTRFKILIEDKAFPSDHVCCFLFSFFSL